MCSCVFALILAGGTGSRFGGPTNKVYEDLGGKELLRWSVDTFQSHPRVKHTTVVVNPNDPPWDSLSACKKHFISTCPGGSTRADSEYLGLLEVLSWLSKLACDNSDKDFQVPYDYDTSYWKGPSGHLSPELLNEMDYQTYMLYSPTCDPIVLIHDGARPFISLGLITQLITLVETHGGGAVPGCRASLPLFVTNDDPPHTTQDTPRIPDEPAPWLTVQTPQAFRLSDVLKAHRARRKAGTMSEIQGYDTAQVVGETLGLPIRVFAMHPSNMKVTTRADLEVARATAKLLQTR